MSRKSEILKLRSKGKTQSQIAEILRMNRSTVAYHCSSRKKTKDLNKQTQRRKNIREELKTMAGGKCCQCGYDKCSGALEFHHKDPTTKEMDFAKMISHASRDRLIEEVKKCVLVCANCHREIHAGLIIL